MGKLLINVFKFLISDLAIKLLSSLSLSLGSSFFINSLISDYVERSINHMNAGGAFGDVMALANLARLDECISIMIGGMVFVASYKALKIGFRRK